MQTASAESPLSSLVPKPAVAYVRASTRKQALSCDDQLAAIDTYCAHAGLKIVHVCRDDGISGRLARSRRTAWDQLLALVEAGRLAGGAVVVWSMDRWARDFRAGLLAAWIVGDYDVELHTTDGGRVDLGTVEGQLMGTLKLALAAQETRERGRRVAERKAMHVAAGHWPTRPPYGYRLVGPRGRGVLVPHEREAETVRWIYERYDAGWSPAKIAGDLIVAGIKPRRSNAWAPSTVQQILRGWSYGGIYRAANGQLHPVAHEPLIPRDLWERCRARATGPGQTRGPKPRYGLSGLVTCGQCGLKMRIHAWGPQDKRVRGYRCPGRDTRTCTTTVVAHLNVLEERVVAWWRTLVSERDVEQLARRAVAQEHQEAVAAAAEQRQLAEQVRDLDAQEQRLAQAIAKKGLSGVLGAELDRIRAERAEAEQQAAALTGVILPLDVEAAVHELRDQMARVSSAWDLRPLIDEVVIQPDRVVVVRGFGCQGSLVI